MSKSNYPRLTSKLLALSKSDDYEEAKLEWRITGNVWRENTVNNDKLRSHSCGHPNKCLCGHPIVYHFEIENTLTNVKEIVGSTCIGNWMILRHMSEKLNIPKETITEEMIENWKQEAVQSLVKEAYWKTSKGKAFTFMFNKCKDLDLRINVRNTGKTYFDKTLQKFVNKTEIRKRSSGEYGIDNYEMASIVWRWNHPDNPKAQIRTTGYPNEKLFSDLSLFNMKISEHLEKIEKEDMEFNARLEVLQDATPKFSRALSESILQSKEDREFKRLCESKAIPYFDMSFASNDWEADFIKRMRLRITEGQAVSKKQSDVLVRIVNQRKEMATEKQINYLKTLGYKGDFALLTKNSASKEIDNMIKKKEKIQ